MNNNEIYLQLKSIFREVFDDETIVPKPDMTAQDVVSWDSLSNIRMIVEVEESFNIRFTSAEISSLKNVGEFVNVIKNHLSKKS